MLFISPSLISSPAQRLAIAARFCERRRFDFSEDGDEGG
jgi:hypothetical protein